MKSRAADAALAEVSVLACGYASPSLGRGLGRARNLRVFRTMRPRGGRGKVPRTTGLRPTASPVQQRETLCGPPCSSGSVFGCLGGEEGIRTLGTFRYTRFPVVHLRPLGHLSRAVAPRDVMIVQAGQRPRLPARLLEVQRRRLGGGERGIRTPGTLTGTPDFESGTFNRSVISPPRVVAQKRPLRQPKPQRRPRFPRPC